ncbi:hypothetical protein Q8F55_008551 [Vanrija albida]|uniref:Uncharacterized protein n=1 Tax=Vanrija albida TaxID=181172 RepID=A0ABR3PR59_9TREE
MVTSMRLLLPPYDTLADQDSAPQEVCMRRWAAADPQPAADRRPAARAPPAADAMELDDAYAPSDVQKKTKRARPTKKVRIAALPYAKPKPTPGAVAHPADPELRIQGPAPTTKSAPNTKPARNTQPGHNTKPSGNRNCRIFKITGIPCPKLCSGAVAKLPLEVRLTSCAHDRLHHLEDEFTSPGGDDDYIELVRTHMSSAVDAITDRSRQFDGKFRSCAAAAEVLAVNSPAPPKVISSQLHKYLRATNLWSDICYGSLRRLLRKYLKDLGGDLSGTVKFKERQVRLAAATNKFTKAIDSTLNKRLGDLRTSVEGLEAHLKKFEQPAGNTTVDTTVPDMIAGFGALRMTALEAQE